jgi:GDP-mannose pyrophosphatase NudK
LRKFVADGVQKNEVIEVVPLLEGWSKVIRVFYRQLRRNGSWQLQERDLVDRGHGVSVLLHSREKKTVLLLRQPRIVATLNGDPSGETIEVCNGLIEGEESPLECAYREVEQETGHRPLRLIPVTEVYASPGGSLEVVHLFFGEYDTTTSIGFGGGLSEEGEDIELVEFSIDQAMRLIEDKTIRDARSILLIQFLYLRGVV